MRDLKLLQKAIGGRRIFDFHRIPLYNYLRIFDFFDFFDAFDVFYTNLLYLTS
jgi:hypothetical protein